MTKPSKSVSRKVQNLHIINEGESLFYSSDSDRNETGRNEKLLLVFIGGGFVYNAKENYYEFCSELSKYNSKAFDILIFNYPVRFGNNLTETMLAINSVLIKYKNVYRKFYGLGVSAGALLCGTFIAKEFSDDTSALLGVPRIGLNIEKFISLDGLLDFGPLINKSIINTMLVKMFLLKNVANHEAFSCCNIPRSVAKLLISSVGDFLYNSQTKLYEAENTMKYVFNNDSLRHCFFQNVDIAESREIIRRIHGFINLQIFS